MVIIGQIVKDADVTLWRLDEQTGKENTVQMNSGHPWVSVPKLGLWMIFFTLVSATFLLLHFLQGT